VRMGEGCIDRARMREEKERREENDGEGSKK
jgi:hypothetical protein